MTMQKISDTDEQSLIAYTAPTHAQIAVAGMLHPLASAQEARAAIDEYEQLKTAIVRPSDIQVIQGRDFLKKSFWRRVAACFGLSLELVGEERVLLDGKLAYRATYRAIAPNGRTMDGDGMCMQGEKGQMIEHNIRAIAHTRAKNRAISDIVGGGEVSAEEMPDEEDAPRMRSMPQSASRAAPSAWKALKDPDIILLLQQMGKITDPERVACVGLIKRELDELGIPWTHETVLTALREEAIKLHDLHELGAEGRH